MTLAGVLVIDKPRGLTSFDVVRRVKRAARLGRVGHGGTLDPLATGVLPVCLGEATKVLQFLLDADKEYEATLCLGVETDTLDADGTVTARAGAAGIGEADVRAALPALTGRIQQVPPAYSALKRDGRPLYDYARAGEAVELAPREVTVHALTLEAWDGPEAVRLSVRCSKGTYVRSLAADLGRALGCGAHLTALRRMRSGPFALAAARSLDDALADLEVGRVGLMSLEAALGHLPRCHVGGDLARDLACGRPIPWSALAAPARARTCVLDGAAGGTGGEGRLLAVVEPDEAGGVHILRGFPREQKAEQKAEKSVTDELSPH